MRSGVRVGRGPAVCDLHDGRGPRIADLGTADPGGTRTFDPSGIEPPPKVGAKWNTEFIRGIGKHNDDFIIILNVDRIFSADELAMVQKAEKVEDEEAA